MASSFTVCRLVAQQEQRLTRLEGDYDCELVVLADGWKLRLVDPYGKAPRLYIRRPGAAEEGELLVPDVEV